MGPRRLREGRERAVTRPLVQLTPTQLAEQAVALNVSVQLERRVPWGSVWERKRARTAVSFTAATEVAVEQKRRRIRDKNKRSIGLSMTSGKSD